MWLPLSSIFILVSFRRFAYEDFQAFQDAQILMYSLFMSTIAAGLVLYTIGRKEFSNYVKDIKISVLKNILEFRIYSLMTFFGWLLAASSLWFLVLIMVFSKDYYGRSLLRTTRDWLVFLISLAWSGFGFMSGLIWLIDGGIMKGDKAPLKKEIDFEEAWKKYPKELFAKYVKQYPHNPSGVLEWHIDKRMKKGITRERAVEELTKEIE